MQYLHKFFFYNPDKTAIKKEFYITSGGIDFLTWFKNATTVTEGTILHLARGLDGCMIESVPDTCNQVVFDGLFFKCTATVADAAEKGGMKRFTAWINPQNIEKVFQYQPDSTEIYFRSGRCIVLANKLPDVMKGLLEHNRKYTERKRGNYGK
jgi:uncharacterized protein YlzI (FlbEa/FlbD family)